MEFNSLSVIAKHRLWRVTGSMRDCGRPFQTQTRYHTDSEGDDMARPKGKLLMAEPCRLRSMIFPRPIANYIVLSGSRSRTFVVQQGWQT